MWDWLQNKNAHLKNPYFYAFQITLNIILLYNEKLIFILNNCRKHFFLFLYHLTNVKSFNHLQLNKQNFSHNFHTTKNIHGLKKKKKIIQDLSKYFICIIGRSTTNNVPHMITWLLFITIFHSNWRLLADIEMGAHILCIPSHYVVSQQSDLIYSMRLHVKKLYWTPQKEIQ